MTTTDDCVSVSWNIDDRLEARLMPGLASASKRDSADDQLSVRVLIWLKFPFLRLMIRCQTLDT